MVTIPAIDNQTIKRAAADDIQVTGDITNGSIVFLTATSGKSITIQGKIDSASVVFLSTRGGGSIAITGKIDGTSSVTIESSADVSIGTAGGDDDKKIDGNSSVDVAAAGKIALGSYISSGTVGFKAHGSISLSFIRDGATVSLMSDGDITLSSQIYYRPGQSMCRVTLVSNQGSITIDGKVDNQSAVTMSAAKNIAIGVGAGLGDSDRKIGGDSFVSATAGGTITLGGDIESSHTVVDFAACGAVTIDKGISGGANVRLLSASDAITVSGAITDSGTIVTFFSTKPFNPSVQGGAPPPVLSEWTPVAQLCAAAAQNGYWWENWSQSYGYVLDSSQRIVPRSLPDLVKAVMGSGNVDRPDVTPVKAVGGAWSFTDASLPFQNQMDVDSVSIKQRGQAAQQDLHSVLNGVSDSAGVSMDVVPQGVTKSYAFSTAYDQTAMRQMTMSGAQLAAAPSKVRIIDTRALASHLHDFNFVTPNPTSPQPNDELLFHVQAGITMADLQQLLDHQSPRLALQASGGSPGATLAGTLATATHGGEFHWQLLVDRVRAIHLIAPGGRQWWIEGNTPVAQQSDLASAYGSIGYIGGQSWAGIPGHPELTAQDVLNAVTVSMGAMGVVYSVVLGVVPQFGLQQVVTPTTWADLLQAAGTTEDDLRAADTSANQKVLACLTNGKQNGTGIDENENVYIDLAMNPLNLDCWVVNRRVTTAGLPDDPNPTPRAPIDAASAFRLAVIRHDDFHHDKLIGRLLNFLTGHTDDGHLLNYANVLGQISSYVGSATDAQSSALALASVQTVVNCASNADPQNGMSFLGDFLSGFFHALQGTQPSTNSDQTGVSYKIGAIGWPDTGLPGRGFEIAMDPIDAFTFLQKVLIDDVLANRVNTQKKPLIGYISVRVTPRTSTVMGMQQYGEAGATAMMRIRPESVMIEVVAYRSPESNAIMDEIGQKALTFPTKGPKPLLHWGLENGPELGYNSAYLATTPLGQPYKGTTSRLDAFRAVRSFLCGKNPPVFDNNFTKRLGL